MKYSIHSSQGVKIILAPMTDSNSTTIQIFVHAGSQYESRKTNWLSHFLEHLFFKWWKRYTTPHAVAQAVDAFGGEFNAYTSDQQASYYVKCAPEYSYQAIDVLSDMMVHACFPAEELEREKNVVLQEMKMIQDNPQRAVMSYWKRFFYGDTLFGWPVIGTEDNVLSFTQQDLFDHKHRLYTKDNLIVVVSWSRSDNEQLLTHIGHSFESLPEKTTTSKPVFERQRPSTQQESYLMKTQQAHVVISAVWYPIHDHRRYAAKLLAIILWWWMSSRLFQRIREKLWACYYISCSHSTDDNDGVFIIRAGIDKTRFDEIIDRIYDEIQLIVDQWVTEEELINAQWYLTGQTKMGIETSDDMAEFIGDSFMTTWEIESLEDILHKYKQVTTSDIKEVAQSLKRSELYQYRVE